MRLASLLFRFALFTKSIITRIDGIVKWSLVHHSLLDTIAKSKAEESLENGKLPTGLHSSQNGIIHLCIWMLQAWRGKPTLHRSSQAFTLFVLKWRKRIRSDVMPAFLGTCVKRCEEVWRGRTPLHANNQKIYNKLNGTCEEWRHNDKFMFLYLKPASDGYLCKWNLYIQLA